MGGREEGIECVVPRLSVVDSTLKNEHEGTSLELAPGSAVPAEVVERLKRRDSPEQISGRLKLDFPDREDMWVSHEAIYQALYIQTAGSLRHELTVDKALRQGRSKRRPRSKLPARPRGWIGEDAALAKRPDEADDKRVSGHWEGDLIIGSDLRSALVTLDERHTKYTMMRRVCVHDTFTVTDILTIMARELPASLWRSLTWPAGSLLPRWNSPLCWWMATTGRGVERCSGSRRRHGIVCLS